MSIWKNGKLVAGGRQVTPLLSFMWADHILDDISWLRADTFSWQRGSIYQAVYQHLANDIDGKSLQSETVGGTTIQFYLADDGHKICPESEMSNVAAIYATTGVAWYYIIDTVNERFKLPRTKFGFTGLRDNVGKYVAPGAPNITGLAAMGAGLNSGDSCAVTDASGAFYAQTSGSVFNTGAGGYVTRTKNLGFDASRSSSVYGNSDTVQSPATQMYLYFYVGVFTQTALENTAGLNAELFNDKVDLGSSWGFPSDTYDTLTLGASGTDYIAPADGWYFIEVTLPSGAYFNATVRNNNGVLYRVTIHSTSAGYNQADIIPIKKGNILNVDYNNVTTTNNFRFIYAQKTN